MDDLSPTRPRNQLGQPATKTPEETIARLKEKVAKNHGGANRERIRAQISEGLSPIRQRAPQIVER
jgi:hypothetical protein